MSKKRKKEPEAMPPLPEDFILSMKERLGTEEAESLAEALDGTPSVSVRINRRKVSDPAIVIKGFGPEFSVSPVPWCSSGFYLSERPDFIHDPLLHAGAYYVQEAASMVYENIIENLTDVPSFPLVLDLCAAPGGKSTAILNGLFLNPAIDGYTLVANEFDSRRARILKENLDKWGDPDVIITNSDTARFSRLEGLFDIVAVDAPCSGEGMMRREPIARTQWSENLVERCALLQRDILTDAVSSLREGGWLIFSTCTFNDRENEANVKWLQESLGLTLIDSPRHFFPHKMQCEGLFISLFRKPLNLDMDRRTTMNALQVAGILEKAKIRVLGVGTETVSMKGNLEVPSARQVLAYDYDCHKFPIVNLNRNDAVAFLKGNSLQLDASVPKGYVAVEYEGFPLGLLKNLGTRANNLYPSEWRILN